MSAPRYLALIGKSPALAEAELSTVLHRHHAEAVPFSPPYVFELIGQINPDQLITELGGTVKIYRILDSDIATVLLTEQQDHFCLSSIRRSFDLVTEAHTVKQALKETEIKPHFKLLDNPFYSAGIPDKYAEFCFIPNHDQTTTIAQAVAVQNLEYWTQKDYGRPAFDPSSGMLPPKVARMMLNLALPHPPDSETRIYDPMCGSGTILLEGLDLNLNVLGSDISPNAIQASLANTDWFKTKLKPESQARVFLGDATHVSQKDTAGQVDAIVFEGYLGPPHPVDAATSNLIKGLEKLYKGVFKNLLPLLKPQGRLVCALPEYHTRQGVKNLDHLVDGVNLLGYTRLNRFAYGREQAFTKRAIYVLQKA